jgi:hypothetical protein
VDKIQLESLLQPFEVSTDTTIKEEWILLSNTRISVYIFILPVTNLDFTKIRIILRQSTWFEVCLFKHTYSGSFILRGLTT